MGFPQRLASPKTIRARIVPPKILFYGDSITVGANASGYEKLAATKTYTLLSLQNVGFAGNIFLDGYSVKGQEYLC